MDKPHAAPPPDDGGDGPILSPGQARVLAALERASPPPAPRPDSPPAAPARPPEPDGSDDPPQPLRPNQAKYLELAVPATDTGVLVRKPALPDEPFESPPPSIGALDHFIRSLRWAGAAALAVLLLLTFVLLSLLVNQVRAFPTWLQPVGYVVVAVALALGGWVLFGLCRRFARLATTPRVQLGVEARLEQVRLIRGLEHHERFKEVRDQLAPLVRDYELTPPRRELLLRCGATQHQLDTLLQSRGRLLDMLAGTDPLSWLCACHDDFYAVLDAVAATCCHRAMARLFVMTSAAPKGLIDDLLVLYATLKHLDDLCQIYNVKTQNGDTLRLLIWVVSSVALTQPIEHASNYAGDHVTSALSDWLSTGSHMAASMVANTLGVVVGKVSNGAVHALLLSRVSAAARRYLMPVHIKRK